MKFLLLNRLFQATLAALLQIFSNNGNRPLYKVEPAKNAKNCKPGSRVSRSGLTNGISTSLSALAVEPLNSVNDFDEPDPVVWVTRTSRAAVLPNDVAIHSAIAVSLTRKQRTLFRLPRACPVRALDPNTTSKSAIVWVAMNALIPAPPPLFKI